jgi:hypothetical protein
VDAAERRRVIDRAIAELKVYYICPDVGQKMADALLEHEKSGDDDAETDGAAFADLLTAQMREASHDRHLGVGLWARRNSNGGGGTGSEKAASRSQLRRDGATRYADDASAGAEWRNI